MAVESIGDNAYELTADNDELLEKIKVTSFSAYTGANAGQIVVIGNIIHIAPNGVITLSSADQSIIWQSGAMNANGVSIEPVDIGWVYGVHVDMPADARLVIHVE